MYDCRTIYISFHVHIIISFPFFSLIFLFLNHFSRANAFRRNRKAAATVATLPNRIKRERDRERESKRE